MKTKVFWPAFIVCFFFSQLALAQSLPVVVGSASPPVRMVAAHAKLPMSFEQNQGQADNRVKFLSRGRGYTLFLTADAAVLALKSTQQDRASAIRMRLVAANSRAKIAGLGELPGKSNYFVGNDPKKWRAGVPSCERVEYSGIYPHIDLIFHGTQQSLEYDFLLAPGADSKVIQLRIDGARAATISDHGDLVLRAASGEVRLDRPNAYQEVDGKRHSVDARYELIGGHQVRFKIADYDRTKTLVIDPVLAYSTYLGGTGLDIAQGIAVDSSGSVYLVGHTTSVDFPLVSSFQPTINGAADLFVTKLNPTGSAIVYSTYLGGSGTEDAGGLAIDPLGDAYLSGSTASTDFPVTSGAFQTTTQSTLGTAFVTKLNSSGSALVYSTYLGGTGGDAGAGIALDSSGDAYVAGSTNSADFPTANAFQQVYGGDGDAFVSKLNPAGSGLVYSTYIGGQQNDSGLGVALDGSGNAYVVGNTTSLDFPTANALQPACALNVLNGSCSNAFVTKLSAAGSALAYSTYLGGGTPDASNSAGNRAKGVAIDSSGSAYVVGETTALDFPTMSPLQAKCALNSSGDCADIFIAKVNSAGSALVYSTYLGGSAGENAAFGAGIAVDASGNAYVTGTTGSVDFPTANALQPQSGGGADAFVAALNASGTGLIYSSYLGGSGTDDSRALTLDAAGNVYIAGTTDSANFPLANALQSANMGGGGDAFIAKISGIAGQPGITVSPTQITFPPTLINTTSAPVTVTVSNPGTATLLISDVSTQDPFKIQNFSSNITTGILPNTSGTFDIIFAPTGAGPYSKTVSIASNAPTTSIPLQGTGLVSLPPPVITSVSPLSGNRGQSVTVVVTGLNFAAGATVSFSNSGINVQPLCSTCVSPTQIIATITVASDAPIQLSDVTVTNPDSQTYTLPTGFRIANEFPIFVGTATQVAYEPSLAVDPMRSQHIVAAFNVLQNTGSGFQISACGRSESMDGGSSWQFGVLTFPSDSKHKPFYPAGDPWIRYGPSGTLYYTCMASSSSQTGIFIAISSSGLASGFASPAIPVRVVSNSCGSVTCGTDVPSFGIMSTGAGDRLVACWIEVQQKSANTFIYARVMTSFSNGGSTWSTPPTRLSASNEKAIACKSGATGTLGIDSSAAVTWLRESNDTLYVRTSSDGSIFNSAIALSTSSPLLRYGSTTDKVLSIANAQIQPRGHGLSAVWQVIQSSMSQAFEADFVSFTATPFGSGAFEQFLPGTGSCGRLGGMYQGTTNGPTQPSAPFRFILWSLDSSTPVGPIFTSGQDLFGRFGVTDIRYPWPRIGEYTAADCSSTFGWAAWTDLRDGKAEIWGAIVPLS